MLKIILPSQNDWLNKYFNTINPSASPYAHSCDDRMLKVTNGKQYFNGIVFRKKKKVD